MGLLDQLNAQAQAMVEHVATIQSETPIERYFRCMQEEKLARQAVVKLENTVYWSTDGTKNRFFRSSDDLGGTQNVPVGSWKCRIEDLDRDYPIWRFVRIEQNRAYKEHEFARGRLVEARKGIDFTKLPDGIVVRFKTLSGADFADCVGVITHQTAETYVVRVLTSDATVGATARIKKINCVQSIQRGGRSLELAFPSLEAWEARPQMDWPSMGGANARRLRELRNEAHENLRKRGSIETMAMQELAKRYPEELEAIKASLSALYEVKDYSEMEWALSKDDAIKHVEEQAMWALRD